MKTVTQFANAYLKSAIAKEDELVAAGKTPEELAAAMTEALKVEGEKLQLLTHAMKIARERAAGLKRVIVMTLAENEKAPAGAQMIEAHYFLPEFFPSAAGSERPERGRFGDGKRGDRKGGRGGNRGGRDSGGRGGDRDRNAGGGRGEPRAPREQAAPNGVVIRPSAAALAALPTPGGEGRRRRPPRGPRAPRPEGVAAEGAATSTEPRAPRPKREPRPPREPKPAVESIENQRPARTGIRVTPRAEAEAARQAAAASAPADSAVANVTDTSASEQA